MFSRKGRKRLMGKGSELFALPRVRKSVKTRILIFLRKKLSSSYCACLRRGKEVPRSTEERGDALKGMPIGLGA